MTPTFSTLRNGILAMLGLVLQATSDNLQSTRKLRLQPWHGNI